MKKILILGFVALAFVFTSCNDDGPKKDVENSIIKLTLFNNQFAEFNADGEITKGEKSEFATLKKTAQDYYESINKINSNIADEKADLAEGKDIDNYEAEYNQALAEKKSEIDEATKLFKANIMKLK